MRRGRELVASKARGGQTRRMTGPDNIAVLRIELEDIEPLIWRRVAELTSMNLKALHRVIQAAMGWLDYHLWSSPLSGPPPAPPPMAGLIHLELLTDFFNKIGQRQTSRQQPLHKLFMLHRLFKRISCHA